MSWLDTLEHIRTRDYKKAKPEERAKAARDVINVCSYACAVVAVSPLPFSDIVLSIPIQTAMVGVVGHIYGRRITKADAKDLVLEFGAVAGLTVMARQGIKALLPVVGALLTVPAAFAANWAIGRVAMEYFKNPQATRDDLAGVYQRARDEAKSLFSKARFDEFKKRAQEAKPKKAPARRPRRRTKRS